MLNLLVDRFLLKYCRSSCEILSNFISSFLMSYSSFTAHSKFNFHNSDESRLSTHILLTLIKTFYKINIVIAVSSFHWWVRHQIAAVTTEFISLFKNMQFLYSTPRNFTPIMWLSASVLACILHGQGESDTPSGSVAGTLQV